ncbi:PBP1 and LysM peptidoglycan-binding domain-containing protein [Viscerimonas tarda]
MKLKYWFLAVTICLSGITQALYSKTNQELYRYHTVSKGETVYSIAKNYNVSVTEIYELNPQIEKGLKPNESLRIPQIKTGKQPQQPYVLHSIQVKETLYSVAKRYNVSIEDILAANEGLTTENFIIGHVIHIPKASAAVSAKPTAPASNSNIVHKVQSKETLYSIARQYNVSTEQIIEKNPLLKKDGLKKDSYLQIPGNNGSNSIAVPTTIVNAEPNLLYQMTSRKSVGVIRIALLLPFLDDSEHQQSRFIEYYEGFLLAIEEMKSKGNSIDLYSFDIRKGKGPGKLKSLLDTYEMKNLDFIIGGVSEDEISLLSEFTKENNIGYAIPFPVKNEEAIKNPRTFRSNVSPTALYPKVANAFVKQFNYPNVIVLVDGNNANNDKKDFIAQLNSNMSKWAISSQTVVVDDNLATNLKSALSLSKKNVIVPASSSLMMLARSIPTIRSIQNQDPAIDISLFGYPDWQTYSAQFLDDFFKYDTYIFSSFYVDNNDAKTQRFVEKFRSWYGKTLLNTYPKYGMLGYDTGLYFITALVRDKSLVQEDLPGSEIPTLQSVFYFGNHNKAGNINTGLYFVHYRTDMSIEKIDYSK